ncbi:MAG: HDOD domain-containing protein [Syntrophaceae bacterium]|nr:HDOD domain-containing protein [Syntrophaceae bacterium]
MSRDLESLVRNINQLPTLPSIVAEINRLVADPDSDAEDVGFLIANDMTIAAKVLRAVNSAHYGFSRKITDIKDAIVHLGFRTVRDIAVSISIFESLGRKGSVGQFHRGKFWEHSLGVGFAAEIIARKVAYPHANAVFMAGLLHDIGKVIFDQFTPDKFRETIDLTSREDILFYESEKRVYNYDHAQVGAWMLEQWKLSEDLCEAVGFHHSPSSDKVKLDGDMTAIVHLADIFTRAINIGSGGDNRIPEINGEVAVRYQGLLESNLVNCFEEVSREMKKAGSFLKFLQ